MIFKALEDNKGILINVDKVPHIEVEYPDLDSNVTLLSIEKQRFFYKKLELFVKDLNHIGENLDGFVASIIELNYIALTVDTHTELLDIMYDYLKDETFISYINNRVEETYLIDIEEGHELGRENASVLQFTNRYAKRILAVALFARLTFPIICTYINTKGIHSGEGQKILIDAMHRIIAIYDQPQFSGDTEITDLSTKIQRFVQVNVENTLYSDKVIWSKLDLQNITKDTIAQDICRSIFSHIIPKIELGRSVVSFLHVFIKNQIGFEFHKKFKTTYKPIKRISTDEDSINPFITVEQRLTKSNTELDNLLIQLEVKNYIEEHDRLTEEELRYHLKHVEIHTAQTRILGFFISKCISQGIPVLGLNKVQYVKLLFIAKKWFEDNGFLFISFILLGTPTDRISIRQNLGRGKNLMDILNSKIYNDLLSHYNYMGNRIDFNMIIGFINELVNTNFDEYIMPNGEGYYLKEISVKDIVFEILRFIESL